MCLILSFMSLIKQVRFAHPVGLSPGASRHERKSKSGVPFQSKAKSRCAAPLQQSKAETLARRAALAAPPASRCASGKASETLRSSRRHAGGARARAPASVAVSCEAAPPHRSERLSKPPKARDAIQTCSSEVPSSSYILNEVVSPGQSALKAVGRALLTAV